MKEIKTIEVIEVLKAKEMSFYEHKTFSKLPGIYAVFFIGEMFPVLGNKVKKHDIIYIGKTESSQEKRGLNTHFRTGKTGSSTLRKSIGALLGQEQKLKPIPRNNSDYQKRKFSHFQFDTPGEKVLTEWMKNNLALSFYEFSGTKEKMDTLEKEVIEIIIPVLNLSNNPNNGYKDRIQQLRKECAFTALKECKTEVKSRSSEGIEVPPHEDEFPSKGKYLEFWRKLSPIIKEILVNKKDERNIQLAQEDFKRVGNRKDYSFNLEVHRGIVTNNIGGSAVARDLFKVIDKDPEIKELLNSEKYKFSMGKDFCLKINKKEL